MELHYEFVRFAAASILLELDEICLLPAGICFLLVSYNSTHKEMLVS
jgi:hypothetical protein